MTTAAQAHVLPPEVARWRADYGAFAATLPPNEPEWLRTLRAGGIGAFEETGFPTLKHEDWRHTSVAPIARTVFHLPNPGDALPARAVVAALTFGQAFAGHELVFVNGRHAPALSSASMADGVQPLHSMGAAVQPHHSMGAGVQPNRSTGAGVQPNRSTGAAAQPLHSMGAGVQPHHSMGAAVQPHHSMGAGVQIRSLREVLDREPQLVQPYLDRQASGPGRPFAALNAAFLDDGAVVFVSPGTTLPQPIHLVFYSCPRAGVPMASHPRVLVVAGRASQVSLIESYAGSPGQGYLTNAVTEVVVEDGAIVDHYRLQRESETAFHVASLCAAQGRASRFTSHAVSLGAALSRIDIRQVFAGEGGECVLSGLFMGRGRQHTDIHTWVDHAEPHCSTRELYKGIVDDRARGVFAGRILVRPGAQKTDAIQTNKNLVLSREALVDSLPQLEILADDVKCKHGSTTGQLDPLALFYLRSRGIGGEAARALLTYAFASDVVQRMRVEPVRAGLTEYLQQRLPAAAGIQEAAV